MKTKNIRAWAPFQNKIFSSFICHFSNQSKIVVRKSLSNSPGKLKIKGFSVPYLPLYNLHSTFKPNYFTWLFNFSKMPAIKLCYSKLDFESRLTKNHTTTIALKGKKEFAAWTNVKMQDICTVLWSSTNGNMWMQHGFIFLTWWY